MYRPGTYKIFASFQSKAYDPDSEEFKIMISSTQRLPMMFEEYLNNIKNLSLYYDEENAPSFGDELLHCPPAITTLQTEDLPYWLNELNILLKALCLNSKMAC